MRFKRKEKGKRIKYFFIGLLVLIVIGPAAWFMWLKFEGTAPEIQLNLGENVLSAMTEVSGTLEDNRSGIRKLWMGLIKDGNETILLEKTFDTDADHGQAEDDPNTVPFHITINTKKLGVADGKAVFRMAVWDHSWRNWGKGNRAYLEKEILFDTRAPHISVLTSQHNLSQGGTGLIVYRLSESCEQTGVYVGEEFFPGYSGYFDDNLVYLALFALGYDQGKGTDLYVKAVDAAGNDSQSGFYHYIRSKQFKTDVLGISDRFLKWKMPEFSALGDAPNEASLIDQFLYVNQTLRQKNNQTILGNGQGSEKKFYWEGVFERLPNSARRASFADHRIYKYHDKQIDRAVHMGIDLASVRHADVPSANAGKIVFAGEIGIYGNTVVIDHGYGLFSVYSHLSRVAVSQGAVVAKGEIIGNTGTTGLAGGDHLHYGMFVDHIYVNPVEWWDSTWIKHNITSKLAEIQDIIH